MIGEKIHPEILQAMRSIECEEVQEMLQRLGKYGLAIAVPHMHNEAGEFLPLPDDVVSLEDSLEVSFRKADDPLLEESIPVMWRSQWDGKGTAASKCVCRCKATSFCGHHHRHIQH